MRLFLRIFVSILAAAMIAGAMPVALALGCITAAPPAAAPCEHGGCDDSDDPTLACICIHYLAPEARGSLAVCDAPPRLMTPAAIREISPAPPDAVPAREDPPEPPPPRSSRRRA